MLFRSGSEGGGEAGAVRKAQEACTRGKRGGLLEREVKQRARLVPEKRPQGQGQRQRVKIPDSSGA